MAKNFAITIGINEYGYIPSLKYAARDAEKVRDFLLTEAGFNQVFYYSDHSPSINNVPTRPTYSSLRRLLKLTFEKEFMGAGDNFWFFFSGHGARVKGVDYIFPSDVTEDIEYTAISVNYIIERLQRCGADNVVLILDISREDLSKSITGMGEQTEREESITGMGEQTEREAREKGVIIIFSCSPNESSWDLPELQQGAFTYALLEGLGSQHRKATVEQLNEYLKYRVKELTQHKGQQTPCVVADPIEKYHLILMPKYATIGDIAMLPNLIKGLQRDNNDLTAREIADILWLSVRLWVKTLPDGELELSEANQEKSELPKQNKLIYPEEKTPLQQSDIPEPPPKRNLDLYPKVADQYVERDKNKQERYPLQVPDAPVIPNKQQLAIALKSLRRKFPSLIEKELNEAKTIDFIVEQKIWMPIEQPVLTRRWLDLVLVVEVNNSLVIWKQTIKELRDFLKSLGITVRNVETWGLKINPSQALTQEWLFKFALRVSPEIIEFLILSYQKISIFRYDDPQMRLYSPEFIGGTTGKTLILLVSDLVSPVWYHPETYALLQRWKRKGMVNLLQLLPERLWPRTTLGQQNYLKLKAPARLTSNQNLTILSSSKNQESSEYTEFKLPVVCLDPNILEQWSKLLMGVGNNRSVGYGIKPYPNYSQPSQAEITAAERVERFQEIASPKAARLAELLSAVLVTLPVIRVIQYTMLPKSNQGHVAEVLMGGLFKPLSETVTPNINPDEIEFEFFDGVRDELLSELTVDEITDVIEEVSFYLADKMGKSLKDFEALLINSQNRESELAKQVYPLAQVQAEVLEKLGGVYADFANQIKGSVKLEEIEGLTKFETEIEVATIVFEEVVNIKAFRRTTNPNKALNIENVQDKAYYIDFASVRGDKVITKLKNKITISDTDEPTCSLVTGYIGCGISTELLRLKVELENKNFHVVYFDSSEDLEVTDVDIVDVLLVIARRISENLEENKIQLETTGLRRLAQDVGQVLNAEVKGLEIGIPKLGKIGGITNKEREFSLSFAIGKTMMMAKSDHKLRQQFRQYLEPRKMDLIRTINQELLEPAIAKLKQQGKEGLVVIVNKLDRVQNTVKPFGISQQEYLFIYQGEYLKGLNCHIVYTMPRSLMFSNDFGRLYNRFGENPNVLPMIPVKFKNGTNHEVGMELLQQMVLARAFPNLEPEERLPKIVEIFDSTETLDRLCRVSGGHVRDLLILLNTLIMEELQLPLSGRALETVIRSRRNKMTMAISDQEWELLRQVKQRKKVSDEIGYQKLIRSHFVFEYIENDESWFDINPILEDAPELKIN